MSSFLKSFMPLYIFFMLHDVSSAQVQKQSANWYYGHYCGLTFNSLPPVSVTPSQIYTNEGCASISDENGNLLFYSDGVTVWNRNHTVMPNGTGLHGHNSSSQSCLIAPNPGNEDQYYVFTAPDYSTNHGLEYSIIDMTLQNGFGDVTSVKNVVLLTNSTEKLTAVYHRNGIEYWVIGHSFESSDFYAWRVTTSGIGLPVISTSGTPHKSDSLIQFSDQNKLGCMKASPCGDKLACAVLFDSFLELFDFNDSSGVVSNPLLLGTWSGLFPYGIYGVEFSPGCSKLYASNESPPFVVQYDLLAGSPASIVASADTVCTSTFDYYGTLQNGLDGKVYLARIGNNNIGCIQDPDLPGAACNYDPYYADAGGSAVFGLPNFITSWFKNSLTAVENINENLFELYPNPVSDFVHLSSSVTIKGTIQFETSAGALVSRMPFSNMPFDMHGLPAGMYFVTLFTEDRVIRKKIIKGLND